ncbi:carbohydrate ABC transporter membrane protein 1, CUT1 family [Thermomonospora echinospora]|uniref:Carbohydrate ABC transporter membrane protein 1, CUT1 family n=1 Tax=Thermomonospora echinospora TaxID=1992 RepID=A0A1H6D1S1_9ACTN|nr:carbohydrate ABC transporter membrane protein 1, CUT1 family [Thermomonospora echinospora]
MVTSVRRREALREATAWVRRTGETGRAAASARRVPWIFVAPAAALCSAVLLIPSLLGAFYAFTEWDGLTAPKWVGLGNFAEFFTRPEGTGVLAHTLVIVVCYVVGVNAVGLGLALGLERALRTRNVLRTLFFVPAVVSPLVVAYVWKFILDTHGPLNTALEALGLGAVAQPWLAKPETALPAIIGVMVWQFSGYHMLIYLAGLQGIQAETREAAMVDGAGSWLLFRHIILPQLRPAITIGVALSTIISFTLFDQVMALTGGGPSGKTETLGTYVYKQAFVNGQYGYSAAVALLLVGVVCVAAAGQLRALRREDS